MAHHASTSSRVAVPAPPTDRSTRARCRDGVRGGASRWASGPLRGLDSTSIYAPSNNLPYRSVGTTKAPPTHVGGGAVSCRGGVRVGVSTGPGRDTGPTRGLDRAAMMCDPGQARLSGSAQHLNWQHWHALRGAVVHGFWCVVIGNWFAAARRYHEVVERQHQPRPVSPWSRRSWPSPAPRCRCWTPEKARSCSASAGPQRSSVRRFTVR